VNVADSAPGLRLAQEGPVVTVTIDRGDGNRMSMAMCRALTELLTEPPAGARLVRLRAEGPAFCLGRDRGGGGEEVLRREAGTLVRLNGALGGGELITVAEVAGDAAGYGVGLAALCDLSFAAPSARFWFPEVEAGLAPTIVLSWLPSLVGRSQAFRLTATATRITGREAASLGLVTGVAASDDDLPGLVEREVAMLLRCPPDAQRGVRAFLRDSVRAGPAEVEKLSVDRLVHNSLRLRPPEVAELVD
jgi:methylglutaconyl-CoA hydratase